ncbi:MAG: DUF86 domain-containing protein [Sulfuritalea sp.]|nr:DUF86 domain-containing protein [Sulfuritalea sp.]
MPGDNPRVHRRGRRCLLIRPQDPGRGDSQSGIVGQIVRDLGPETLAAQRPEVPWVRIAGARNILAHQYLGVDLSLVCNIVERDLTALEAAVAGLLEE